MRILFLQDDFPPASFGGAGISTYELALGVKKAGHEVFIITTCRNESEAGESEYHGLKMYKIASDYHERWRAWVSLHNPPVVRQVEELLKKIRPDVVHANNIHFHLSYHCLKVAKKYTKVVVFTARDAMAFTYGKLGTKRYLKSFDARVTWLDNFKQAGKRWNLFRNVCVKRYLAYADKVFVVSGALKKALEENGIRHVEVMHTGADVSAYIVSQESVVCFKEKHGLANKKIVLFGGRLSDGKGGRKALEAMAIIAKEIPDAVLLIAGSIDGYAQLMKAEAHALGIVEKFIFTGWIEREEMKTAYAVADVVLVPSLCLDAFPRTVVEAMASGKPVIATCYGGAPEIIVNGITGYVVNPLRPQEIADKTLDILQNPEKAAAFGSAGRARVQSDFNLDRKIHVLIARYSALLQEL